MDQKYFSLYLLVVAGVESAVGNAEKSARLGVVGILAITLKEGEGSDEITLLEEVAGIWQLHLLLLKAWTEYVSNEVKLTCLAAWTLGAKALLRLMAETGLAIILVDLNLNL